MILKSACAFKDDNGKDGSTPENRINVNVIDVTLCGKSKMNCSRGRKIITK